MTPSGPNITDIMIHDVNIEETKLETLILALHSSHDQVNTHL